MMRERDTDEDEDEDEDADADDKDDDFDDKEWRKIPKYLCTVHTRIPVIPESKYSIAAGQAHKVAHK